MDGPPDEIPEATGQPHHRAALLAWRRCGELSFALGNEGAGSGIQAPHQPRDVLAAAVPRARCGDVVLVERAGTIVVAPAADGVHRIDDRGHLVLPLAVRRWCRLAAGDRLLLAADPATGVLVGHCFAVLDRLLADIHATVAGSEAA